jgi:dipeptidyl-peptidase-4
MKIQKIFSLLVCLVIFFGFADQISADGNFTLEQILSPPYPWSLVSAKNADRIAWVFYSKGERNVWTAAAPEFKPINLTGFARDEVFEIPEVHITDDGKTVVFVKGGRPNSEGWVTNSRSDPDGMEQAIWAVRTETGQLWRVAAGRDPVLSPDGQWLLIVKEGLIYSAPLIPPADPRTIPEPELLFKSAGQNGSPAWSPDSTRIAFVTQRNDHSFIGIFDTIKRKITWIAPSVDRDSDPAWSADGTKILFQRRPGLQFGAASVRRFWNRGPVTNVAFWQADATDGTAKEIWRFPEDEPRFYSFRNFEVTANDRILFTAERDNWNHVFSMPLSGGNPEDLTPGEAFVEHLGLSGDGKILFFSSNIADINGRHIWKVPTDGRSEPVQITEEATIGTYPVPLASGDKVAFLYATALHPTSIATVPADGGKIEVIAPGKLPAEYPMDELVVPELVVVKAPDGLEIPCQLFLPKDAKPGDKRPGVVYTHGGPIRQMLLGWHYMEFYSEAYGINQYFANNGYVVISINYRSGIGYGRSFRNAPKTGMRGADEYQDILAGAKYLQSRPEVDPERIGKWGLSYGGLLTAMALARNSDIFKVGVDMAGVHDWSQRGRSMPEAQRKLAYESSPVAFLETWTSPVLFIHGDDDRNVDFQQTTDIVQKLRAKGDVHIELMIAPDEPHEFMLYKNRMEAYNRTFEFINRFISEK